MNLYCTALLQLRRPRRPHDVSLFAPSVRGRRVVSFGPGEELQPRAPAPAFHRHSGAAGDRPGEKLVQRVLQHEGLGAYCDEQFIKARFKKFKICNILPINILVQATQKELAEAANLSNQQFNSAARQLLERERAGEIELPMTNRATYRWTR